jgi:hypothetical protein
MELSTLIDTPSDVNVLFKCNEHISRYYYVQHIHIQ